MAGIAIENLTYTYPESSTPALADISLAIEPGEFVLLVGGSGSGKSTLLKAMAGLVPSFYGGAIRGRVLVDGEDVEQMDRRQLVQRVGMVFQDPEGQLVKTTPEDEVAFGLENIGMPSGMIRRRIMEAASALSFNDYRQAFIPELSGGQKQKVALASVLAMHPGILLLDEPTSQLDPIAGEDFLAMVRRLNEENGITVVLSEQKLERCFHFADRVIAIEGGRILKDSRDPGEIAKWAVREEKPYIPSLSKIFAAIGHKRIPVTIKAGRTILEEDFGMRELAIDVYREAEGEGRRQGLFRKKAKEAPAPAYALSAEKLWFTYPGGSEVLKGVSLALEPGTATAIIGANGSGKTTLLKHLNGLLRPGRGKVLVGGGNIKDRAIEDIAGEVGYLSQNPDDYLFLPTVREEAAFALKNRGIQDPAWIEELLAKLDIGHFGEMNPRDLSAGERQRVAFASVLAPKPKILLLDEPTRGLDYSLKEKLGKLLLQLKAEGAAILMVAHDIEFIAEYCDEVVLMDEGTILEKDAAAAMLANSTFYSPQVSRLFHNYAWNTIKVDQGIRLLRESKGDIPCCEED